MNQVPLAKVAMPQRVPWGFHGLWLTSRDLSEQVPAAANAA